MAGLSGAWAATIWRIVAFTGCLPRPAVAQTTATLRSPLDTSLAAAIRRRMGATSRLAKPIPSQIAYSSTTSVKPMNRMPKAICML